MQNLAVKQRAGQFNCYLCDRKGSSVSFFPSRDTFEFDQEHVDKSQPITVLVLLSESQGIKQYVLYLSI